jgi:antitoxin component YwqK of YwqJK toxin-antitoxin module
MKLLLFLLLLGSSMTLVLGQDTIMKSRTGAIEFTKSGKRNQFDISGKYRNKSKWIEGQVKKVRYEYMFTPTYPGCTQTSNPYYSTPQKRIAFYYKPMSDINIWHKDSNTIAQTFNLDSSILRSYYENGNRQNVYFCNELLQIDSVYQYYENGKMKLKQLGNWNAHTDNIILQTYHQAVLQSRKETRPKVEFECHGSGLPQRKTEHLTTDSTYAPFKRVYTMFDINGIITKESYTTKDHQWTGIEYKYYKSGKLSNKNDLYRGRPYGECEYWNQQGDLIYRKYLRKGYSDSIVFYKRIRDSIISYKDPVHFKWDRYDSLEMIRTKTCTFQFHKDGSIIAFHLDGLSQYSYTNQNDERFNITHHGEKDEFGLPNGRWLGINPFEDTLYDINFKHGWLHGNYHVDFIKDGRSWTKNYKMGVESDSSYYTYKNIVNNKIYYSEPGKIIKQMNWFSDGQLNSVDTSINGKTLITLASYREHMQPTRLTTFDTINKRLIQQSFNTEGQLESETITDYFNNVQERKYYHLETGKLKSHWISQPSTTKASTETYDKYDERGEITETIAKVKRVTHSIGRTYDQKGNLIKEEIYQDGSVVE